MNQTKSHRLLAPLLGCVLFALNPAARAAEVTAYYEVTLDGKKIMVAGDASTNAVVGGKEVSVSVRESPWKKFNDGNITFLFPAEHAMEKQVEDEFINWTLDGQDNVVMIYRLKKMDGAVFAKALVGELKTKYGKESGTEDCECSFGGTVVKGTRITARIAGEVILQEIFHVPAGKSDYVIIIQNAGDATPSAEAKAVREKLKETFSPAPSKSGVRKREIMDDRVTR